MGNNSSVDSSSLNATEDSFAIKAVKSNPKLDLMSFGDENTTEFRIHGFDKEKQTSMWHDVKLYPTPESKSLRIVNMVNEIPRCSRKKYEIATNEVGNPIKQDVKKGKLREFAKGDLYFNYGCIPRTWEDPDVEHHDAKAKGDNDPLDVCEIGLRILKVGEICPVKILGTLCLIDEGEADWKMIAISVLDPWAPLLNNVSDLEERLPGMVHAIREWFRTYKIPDGKPENKFGLEGRCMDAEYAMGVIEETHQAWRSLVLGLKDEQPVETVMTLSDGTLEPTQGSMKRNLSYPKLSHEDLTKLDHS